MEILSRTAAGAPPHTSDTPEELEEGTTVLHESYMSATGVSYKCYNNFTTVNSVAVLQEFHMSVTIVLHESYMSATGILQYHRIKNYVTAQIHQNIARFIYIYIFFTKRILITWSVY